MIISFKEIKQQTEKLVNEYFDETQEHILKEIDVAVSNKQSMDISVLSLDLSRTEEDRRTLIRHIHDSESVVSMINCILESITSVDDNILDIETHIFDELFGIKIEHENV
jgi:hypothetical protein